MAADYPVGFTPPADKTKRLAAGQLPKADAQPPLSSIPVEAHFFPSLGRRRTRARARRFHGDEQPGGR
jgi:hypothetical protein